MCCEADIHETVNNSRKFNYSTINSSSESSKMQKRSICKNWIQDIVMASYALPTCACKNIRLEMQSTSKLLTVRKGERKFNIPSVSFCFQNANIHSWNKAIFGFKWVYSCSIIPRQYQVLQRTALASNKRIPFAAKTLFALIYPARSQTSIKIRQ